MRALESEGWVATTPEGRDEWLIYRHPERPDAVVAVNPHWSAIWEDDPAFRVLCHDMGLTPDRLVDLLALHGN